MKILFVSALWPHPRGISGSAIVYHRIRYLHGCGHQIGLIGFLAPDDEPHRDTVRPFLEESAAFPLPAAQPSWRQLAARCFSAWPRPFRELRSPALARAVGERVARGRYDVVIAEFSVMGQYLFQNPWLPAVRRIVSVHECCTTARLKAVQLQGWTPRGWARRMGLPRLRRYEFTLYRHMDHLVALTSQERYELLKYAPSLRIAVVSPGVDVAYFTPPPADTSEERLLFVGYYGNEANRDAVRWFARTVWPELKRRFPALTWYLVGRGVTSDVRDLGRRDARILVRGAVDDLRPYLAKSRVFLCPMRIGSGFRAKVLEAMAAGVPVVATALGTAGIPAWNGETLFMADTPGEMVRDISLLLRDTSLRRAMAAKARELVVAQFSQERGLRALDEVVREVVRYD